MASERTVPVEEIDDNVDRREPRFRVVRFFAMAALAVVVAAGSGSAAAASRTSSSEPGAVSGDRTAGALFIGPTVPPAIPASAPADEVEPAEATGAPVTRTTLAEFTTALPDARARVAIDTALAQIGLPYVWGGNGPTAGHAGFDCSGLTTFSYKAAGVPLPRTAHTQYYAGPHVPTGAPLQPGDLVFYGTPAKVHHVGLYLGAGRMVNAPTFGKPVQTAYYRWGRDDYLGATRPAATGQPSTGPLPSAPPAPPPPADTSQAPPVFEAPPAPLPETPLPAPTDPQPPEPVTAADAIGAASAFSGTTTGSPTEPPPPILQIPAPGAPTTPPGSAQPTTAPAAGSTAPVPGRPTTGTSTTLPDAPTTPPTHTADHTRADVVGRTQRPCQPTPGYDSPGTRPHLDRVHASTHEDSPGATSDVLGRSGRHDHPGRHALQHRDAHPDANPDAIAAARAHRLTGPHAGKDVLGAP